MTTHLIVITETREFVYEVEVPDDGTYNKERRARAIAIDTHTGQKIYSDSEVSLHRANPIKYGNRWLSSRKGSIR